jgi:hypothetical protein
MDTLSAYIYGSSIKANHLHGQLEIASCMNINVGPHICDCRPWPLADRGTRSRASRVLGGPEHNFGSLIEE